MKSLATVKLRYKNKVRCGRWRVADQREADVYTQKENANALEKSLESLAAQPASSKSTQCDSSASNYEEPETDQLSEPSTGMKKLKLIGELQSYNHQQTFSFEDQNRRTEEPLEFHQSSFATNSVKATSNSLSDPAVMDSHDSMAIVIVNVELSVHTSPQAEHVPFVSLTSEACGITVLGYPLDVREITDSSQTLPPPEGSGDRGTSLNHSSVGEHSKEHELLSAMSRVCFLLPFLRIPTLRMLEKMICSWKGSNSIEAKQH